MAQTVSNVSTGKPGVSGGVYVADSGTSLPASVNASLSSFTALGYVSEDGLTNSNSPESDTGKAWGGDIVITYQTEKPDTFQFTLIESKNVDVLEVIYGEDNVSGTLSSGVAISANADEAVEHAWVFDMIMRNDTYKRICVPAGKIIELGDIVYKDDELVGYDVTIQAFPDSSGNTHYEYIQEITVSS